MAEEILTQAQTLERLSNALRDDYLPAWKNQIGIEPSALLSRIKRVRVAADGIIATAPYGLSGGFGYGAEGAATPAAGRQLYERFKTTTKDMYVNVVISQKAITLGTGKGSMVNAVDSEVKAAFATAKWNMGRSLFGNGKGILAETSAMSASGNVITVADTKNLKVGLIIDIYKTNGTLDADGRGRRILAVDKAGKKITVDGTAKQFAAGFITVQNSYNREITGLGAIFDDNITEIWGVSKSDNPIVKPTVKDAGGDLDETVLNEALFEAEDEHNSEVDMLLCSTEAYNHYVTYLRNNNHRVEEATKVLKGGFKAIEFLYNNRVVDIVHEKFIPAKEIWGVNTKSIQLHDTDWEFAQFNGSGVFQLMEGSSNYRALLYNYGNLICDNPGGCIRISNCA